MTSSPARAIIHISTSGKNDTRLNYSRRMYAIIRRYTPDVEEGTMNECFAELTGLRTFFKMTYAEIAEKIKKDLAKEIGIRFTIKIASVQAFEHAKARSKKLRSVSTYKEIKSLFAGSAYMKKVHHVSGTIHKKRFSVPFIGKVS